MFKDPEKLAAIVFILFMALGALALIGFGVSRAVIKYQEDSAKLECQRSGRYIVNDEYRIDDTIKREWRCSATAEKSP